MSQESNELTATQREAIRDFIWNHLRLPAALISGFLLIASFVFSQIKDNSAEKAYREAFAKANDEVRAAYVGTYGQLQTNYQSSVQELGKLQGTMYTLAEQNARLNQELQQNKDLLKDLKELKSLSDTIKSKDTDQLKKLFDENFQSRIKESLAADIKRLDGISNGLNQQLSALSTKCRVFECNGGDWTTCQCPADAQFIKTGGCGAGGGGAMFAASYPESLTSWVCGGHGTNKKIRLICCPN